jgi:hypothetical protein
VSKTKATHLDRKPNTPEQAMRVLADWLDVRYGDAGTGGDEIQQDLRRFADDVAALRRERDRLLELLMRLCGYYDMNGKIMAPPWLQEELAK